MPVVKLFSEVIFLKKKLMILCIVVAVLLLVAILLYSSSRKNEKKDDYLPENETEATQTLDETGTDNSFEETRNDVGTGTEETGENNEEDNMEGDVIKNLEADLNKDGEDETIEIIQLVSSEENEDGAKEVEGKIRIKEKNSIREKTFVKKAQGFTGIMRDISISDLDGDGYKDIFVIIPETGDPFTLNYFYIYSYKLDKFYTFNTDNKLTEFCKGFKFTYKGKGKLNIENDTYGFKAEVNLAEINEIPISDDEASLQYNNSWVEPIPSEIGASSKLALADTGAGVEISVPLPIFGASVSDIIGEVDLFYSVSKDFEPVMKRFEIHMLDMGKKVKIGEGMIN